MRALRDARGVLLSREIPDRSRRRRQLFFPLRCQQSHQRLDRGILQVKMCVCACVCVCIICALVWGERPGEWKKKGGLFVSKSCRLGLFEREGEEGEERVFFQQKKTGQLSATRRDNSRSFHIGLDFIFGNVYKPR